jgi:1-acyl-sn-glycerol-3-phosphate acyltransferase
MSPGDEGSGLSALNALPRLERSTPKGVELITARRRLRVATEPMPPLYRLLRAACAPVLRSLFDLRVAGVEHVPASGPFIVAANHHNYLDGVVLAVAITRPLAFLVMPRVYHASPLHPGFHRRIGSIEINVERPDPGAIKRALRTLGDGRALGIFPEGPFSRQGRLVRGQPGVALIAARAGVPVVPAGIRGTYEALAGRRFYVPRRQPLSVRFGPPLSFGPSWRRLRHGDRDEAARRIMAEIATLLEEVPAPGARRGPVAS